jgi:hypothetical protein
MTTDPSAAGDLPGRQASREAEDGRRSILSTGRTRSTRNLAAIDGPPEIIPPRLDTTSSNRLLRWLTSPPDPQEARRLLAVDRAIAEIVGRRRWK